MSRHSETSLSGAKVLSFLFAFRICNALLLRTFFQPDEYFQSLEPAWSTAFGETSGAWITWEWKQNLRSSLHPFLFAGVYSIANLLANSLGLGPSVRSEVLLAAPKVVQAGFAALSDYYTWRLAQKAYGETSQASHGALLLTIFSPWQWFCSTRTLSNSVETTLTALALCLWPFGPSHNHDSRAKRVVYKQMCATFAFAALATILRPTNLVIWLVVALYTAAVASKVLVGFTKALVLESSAAAISGVAVLAASVVADRLYYREWTFPPLRFIHFNVVQSLAVFYGRNRPDYYFTEGLPLLLTLSLPFAVLGWYQAVARRVRPSMTRERTSVHTSLLQSLALAATGLITLLSMVSHKEVRFIYPLLPILNVLAADSFSRFFAPLPWSRSTAKKLTLAGMLLTNVLFSMYISQVHQRGVVDVMHYLRGEYEQRYLSVDALGTRSGNMSVTFLMPCHSTPWRSHLVYDSIDARALTCEPPIEVPIKERDLYLDEADQFYDDPAQWLQKHMDPVETISESNGGLGESRVQDTGAWPDYLVFFEQLEPVMKDYLKSTRYDACWRGFNSHWHDDWRRKGEVVVWCLS